MLLRDIFRLGTAMADLQDTGTDVGYHATWKWMSFANGLVPNRSGGRCAGRWLLHRYWLRRSDS
ncbi:hypothetical protein GCM10009716_20860 [Streptomyces sodiiphilus]|uniref:Uncharacterized protein n=1 Tax=Streptomyces sodiiphilus TaxID=226217 RepID=A0ABN2P5V0_9ACTN